MENYNKSLLNTNKLITNILIDNTENLDNKPLKEALSLLFMDGKRLRPIVSLEIVKCLNKRNSTNFNIDKIALISEIIHSASLIIDDLPCMDNDTTRRGNPTIHYKYGETSAHVLTMYLFSLIFSLIEENLEVLRKQNLKEIDKREEIIISTISDNLGLFGAPLGQYLDTCEIGFLGKNGDTSNIKQAITDLLEKKTATFFEIAFILGYVAGGGELDKLDDVKLCAKTFGIAFQISDDFLDVDKDASKCFCPNFVNHMGKEQGVISFSACINIFTEKMEELNLSNAVFDEIVNLLRERVKI